MNNDMTFSLWIKIFKEKMTDDENNSEWIRGQKVILETRMSNIDSYAEGMQVILQNTYLEVQKIVDSLPDDEKILYELL